jgi:transcriptional regulator NrdR family protein
MPVYHLRTHPAASLFVIKKDGRREEYNRKKLLAGISRACEKRPWKQELSNISSMILKPNFSISGVKFHRSLSATAL